jgi:RimJ/RimL family protein N-acetyltransferase
VIETERLILRDWAPPDHAVFCAMNADPQVMRHFHKTLTPAECDEKLERLRGWSETRGYTFWAMQRKSDGAVLGNCGLKPLTVPWPSPDDIEIGWMLAKAHWGQGYAREAAAAALDHGLKIAPRVIAMTTQGNTASWGLMVRLGMAPMPDLAFDHPEVPEGNPLRPHIVYAKAAPC